jgi:preprotein translocase subunit YajC
MNSVLTALLAQVTASPGGQPGGGFLGSPLIMLGLIGFVFYFVIFRPQAKQAKEHKRFVDELKKGDEVLTQGGMIGVIHAVDDRTITLDVGGGTKVRVVKAQVAGPWKPVEAQAKTEARK